MKSALDSILQVSFGIDIEDSIQGSDEEITKFSTAFDTSSSMTLWRYVDVFWPIKKALNIGSEGTLKKNMSIVDEYIYKLIHNALGQRDKLGNNTAVSELVLLLLSFLRIQRHEYVVE